MKYFLLFFALAIHISDGMSDQNVNLTAQIAKAKKAYLDLMKDKCYQNSTENYKRFVELMDNATKCVEVSAGPMFAVPVKTIKDNIQSCVNELIEELEECLPEDSKDWPQLSFDTLYSLLDFMYENKELIFSPKIRAYLQNCVEVFQKEEVPPELAKCVDFFNSSSLDIKTSCQELRDLEKCFMEPVNQRCPGDASIEKLKSGFLEALKEPCAEYDVTDNPVDNVFTLLAPYAPPNMNPDLM